MAYGVWRVVGEVANAILESSSFAESFRAVVEPSGFTRRIPEELGGEVSRGQSKSKAEK